MTTLDDAIRFVVFGHPQGKGSKRVLPIRSRQPDGPRLVLVDSNRNAKPWAASVTAEAAKTMTGRRLIRGGAAVELAFYFARPRAHYRTGRNAAALRDSAPAHMTKMPDVDKLARNAIDALTGVVLYDDALIVELVAGKNYGEPERLEACVRALGAA